MYRGKCLPNPALDEEGGAGSAQSSISLTRKCFVSIISVGRPVGNPAKGAGIVKSHENESN